MTITPLPELKVDIEKTKEYIKTIKDWNYPSRWKCRHHRPDPTNPISKNIMDQLTICPGNLHIISILPHMGFQVHVDETRNSGIIIPIEGDFYNAPVSFYRDMEGKEKLFSCRYEIGSAILMDPRIPHGVENPSDNYRTIIMININDPYDYETTRSLYINGELIKK